MKIVSLVAENVKKLVAVEIRPDGNVVEITGKNGQGKTSVLDAIWWALAGAEHLQQQPIRAGQKTAKIVLRLGGERELVVTRKFSAKAEGGFTTSLTVESADGAKFSSPQTMLDELLGALSFDPLAFARMKPADQFDALKRFVPDFDFAQAELDQKADYDRRRTISSQAREAAAAAAAIVLPVETPDDPVDESALAAELEQVGQWNAEVEREKAIRRNAEGELERARIRIEEIDREVVRLGAERRNIDETAGKLRKTLEARGPQSEPKETGEIRHRMDAARLTNTNVARLAEKKRLTLQAAALELQADEITARREARDEAKRAAIAAAKMPVPGLDFGAGVVLLNGQPFDQASDAEQLRTSVAIAMAANPKLRVIRIRDGSLLDADSMALLADMAKDGDFQVWIETVDQSERTAFVLEDGRLRQQAAEAAA